MYCLTVEDGKEVKLLFYKDRDREYVFEKAKELLECKINSIVKLYNEDCIVFNYNTTSLSDLQSILNVMIKLHNEKDKQNTKKYEVRINYFEFEKVDEI